MAEQDQGNLVMHPDLAEGYRQLRSHVAGSDLIEFLAELEEQAIDMISVLDQTEQIFRAQGFLAALRQVQNRFQLADDVLTDDLERLKP